MITVLDNLCHRHWLDEIGPSVLVMARIVLSSTTGPMNLHYSVVQVHIDQVVFGDNTCIRGLELCGSNKRSLGIKRVFADLNFAGRISTSVAFFLYHFIAPLKHHISVSHARCSVVDGRSIRHGPSVVAETHTVSMAYVLPCSYWLKQACFLTPPQHSAGWISGHRLHRFPATAEPQRSKEAR